VASLSLVFDLLARDKASPTFRQVGDAAEKAGKQGHGFGSSISSGMKLAAGALAAAGLGTMFAGFISDAAESQRISRLTSAAIKSTGGAANITAKQVGDLATAISNKTAVDDEAIQSGANLLLTFTNVRNEVGKGNDIFNQAAAAATDMAVAMGTEPRNAAMQLGKALNDPIKGVTALGRAGVQFTKQQKEQIRTLVESGNTLGAQKIILGELQTQFGGAAAAAADPMQRLRVIAGNLGEQLGGYLLPVIGRLASWITDRAVPAVAGWAASFRQNILPTLQRVGEFITGSVLPAVADFARWIGRNRDVIVPVVAALGAMLAAFRAFMFIKTVIAAVAAFNAVLLANPIGLVVAAIGGLIAILVIAYQRSDTFRRIVDTAFRAVAAAGKWMWENVLRPAFNAIMVAWRALGVAVRWAWDNLIKPAWAALQAGISALWNGVLRPVFAAIGSAWRSLSSGISAVWSGVIRPVFNAFRDIGETVRRSFSSAVSGIRSLWSGLSDTLRRPLQAVVDVVWNNGIRRLWNKVNNLWDGDDVAAVRLASGGVIPGYTPGRDVHRFVSPTAGILDLSGGEAVMRPEFTRALGRANIDTLNKIARTEGEAGLRRALAAEVPLPNIRQGFADGGVLEIPGWMRGEGTGGFLAGLLPGAGLAQQAMPETVRIGAGPAGMLGEIVPGLAKNIWARAVKKAKELFDKSSSSVLTGGGSFGASGGSPNGVGGLGPVAAAARAFVMRTFGLTNIGGYSYRNIAGTNTLSDHALGKAIDVMIPNYRSAASIARGNAVANWFVNNPGAFGTKYVIWRDRINSGRGWQPYGHPGGGGGDTLQHRDHVHVSVYDKGGLLPPGISLVKNGTGRHETVRTAEQEAALTRGGATYVNNFYGVTSAAQIARTVERSNRTMEFLRG